MDDNKGFRQEIMQDAARRIIAAATRLFAAKGYDGVAIREIGDSAGVNTAMVYYYFESKERLFRCVIEQFVSDELVSANKTLLFPRSVNELRVRLEYFIRQTIEAMTHQSDVICIMLRDIERSAHVMRRTIFKNRTALIAFFTQAKKSGLLAGEVDPSFVAESLTTQIFYASQKTRIGIILFGHSKQGEKHRDQWIYQILHILLSGIINDEAN